MPVILTAWGFIEGAFLKLSLLLNNTVAGNIIIAIITIGLVFKATEWMIKFFGFVKSGFYKKTLKRRILKVVSKYFVIFKNEIQDLPYDKNTTEKYISELVLFKRLLETPEIANENKIFEKLTLLQRYSANILAMAKSVSFDSKLLDKSHKFGVKRN